MFEFINYYWNSAQQWWNPPQTNKTPYQLLIHYLQNSGILFDTNQSDQKIVHERLGMMFSKLIDPSTAKNKFTQFYPTMDKPLEHFIYQKTDKEQKIISICGKLKIQTERIKCQLFVSIVIHKEIQKYPPYVYIRNFDAVNVKPAQMMGQKYSIVMGGVKINANNVFKSIQWDKYSSSNLVKLMEQVHNCLHQFFPFQKRKEKLQFNAQKQIEFSNSIRDTVKLQIQRLQATQNLQIMREGIKNEISQIQKDTIEIQENIQKFEENTIQYILQNLKVIENQEILQLLTVQKSAQDCIRLAEKMFQSKQISYEETLQVISEYSQKDFAAKFKISLIKERSNSQKM